MNELNKTTGNAKELAITLGTKADELADQIRAMAHIVSSVMYTRQTMGEPTYIDEMTTGYFLEDSLCKIADEVANLSSLAE